MLLLRPVLAFTVEGSVRRLGEAYLRLRPMEASRESLMAALRHSTTAPTRR